MIAPHLHLERPGLSAGQGVLVALHLGFFADWPLGVPQGVSEVVAEMEVGVG